MDINKQVKEAFEEAEAASKAEFEAYAANAERNADGHIKDAAGLVSVRFIGSRKMYGALKELGLSHPSAQKGVTLRAFYVPEQAITAQEKAAQAGIDVLNERLGDYGKFYMESRMD